MKKLLTITLIWALVFLTGCSTNNASVESEDTSSQTESQETSEIIVEITEENYQDVYSVASEYGLKHTVRAFIKAHPEQFEEASFVDVYLPFEETKGLEYFNDGYAVQSQAHGMKVYQTMVAAATAKEVVDAQYELLKEAGDFVVLEEYAHETLYIEDMDIAYRQVYSLDVITGEVVVSILYADIKQEGFYLYANISYLTEQMSDSYEEVLEEVSYIFALDLPVIPSANEVE